MTSKVQRYNLKENKVSWGERAKRITKKYILPAATIAALAAGTYYNRDAIGNKINSLNDLVGSSDEPIAGFIHTSPNATPVKESRASSLRMRTRQEGEGIKEIKEKAIHIGKKYVLPAAAIAATVAGAYHYRDDLGKAGKKGLQFANIISKPKNFRDNESGDWGDGSGDFVDVTPDMYSTRRQQFRPHEARAIYQDQNERIARVREQTANLMTAAKQFERMTGRTVQSGEGIGAIASTITASALTASALAWLYSNGLPDALADFNI